ncbi:MAG: M20/M25/M40 family metallo-hydrolase [Candidatus Aminicenantes bacterium]|nr:MAG: M20/M25/M40 family metallo-hydrolase [Candidatus Aminicenantes bacterium]
MKVAVIFNKDEIKDSDVINRFGVPSKERYQYNTIEMVASALESGGHNVRIFEGNMHVINELQNFMPKVVRGERPGMIFNMAYGIQGQSRYTHIPAMLEMLGIPYVGSGPAAQAIALDKVMSKIVFLRHQLPTPNFWMFSNPDDDLSSVHFPVIVKPRMEAVSIGLRVVNTEKDLREAITYIIEEFQQQALVEEFIPGREYAVAMLGNGTSLETLPIVEIDLGGDPNAIQTADDKMKHPRRKICPADIPRATGDRLCKLAVDAFNALGLFDFARVDFRRDAAGGIYILEINSMASLNPPGSYVHAAQVAGMSFTELVNRMLDTAAIRYFGKSYLAENGFLEEKENKRAEPLHIRVRSYLRSRLPTTLDYLEKMVSISSHVHDIEGVNEMGNWISNRFQQLGFHRQVFPQTEVGNIFYFSNHLDEQNDILLLTHLDTVHDHRSFVPFRGEHGRVYGSGVTESKGGIAVILAALQALRFARILKTVRCGVLLTPDDNLNGRFSKDILLKYIHRSRYVVGTKYGDLNGGVVVSCSGTQQYQIELNRTGKSKATHIPNVMSGISKKAIAWEKLSSGQEGIEVLLDSLQAERDHASVQLTAYYFKRNQINELDQLIRKIAEKETGKDLQVRIRVVGSRPPVSDTLLNQDFFEKVKKLARLLEVKVEPIHRCVSSDICHASENVPVLGGLGPLGAESGASDEYILRDSLIDRSALLAMIIHNCAAD